MWYEKAGLPCQVISRPDLETLYQVLTGTPEELIIHARCSLGFSPNGGTYLTFRSRPDAEYGAPDYVFAHTWGRLWRSLGQPGRQILIILDVLQPYGAGEILNQALLRNMYAAELCRVGRMNAVLATGLTPPEYLSQHAQALAGGLGSRTSLGQLAQQLRSLGGESPPGRIELDDLPRRAPTLTALFCDDPARTAWNPSVL
jgi:hypothetical protein